MKSEVEDGRIAIARFTVPEGYSGGMPATPLYIYPTSYIGGDANGLYELYVEGLYLYKLDERDELVVRGEDPSDTYIGLNRVRTDTIDEDLKPDTLYIVDDGSMFMTNFRGDRININAGVNTESTGGSSIYYMEYEVEYPTGNSLQAYNVTKIMLSNEGLGIKVDDIIVASNGTLCKVTKVYDETVDYKPIGNITGSGAIETTQSDWNQNDETAADYIKNKPFYEYTEILVDNITVNNGDSLNFAIKSFGNTGDTISIIWDGILTDKAIGYCEAISGNWTLPYNTIGNQSLISKPLLEGGEDTGEDYVIYSGTGASTSTITCDDNSHTLSVVKKSAVQIDEKFIPDTIARKTDIVDVEELKSYIDEMILGGVW
jgi:hypothetical protein